MADNYKINYNKTKGFFTELGSTDSYAVFHKVNGGMVDANLLVGSNMTMSVSQSAIAVTASVNVRLALPSSPRDGQLYTICKAQTAAMTVSLTGTSTAHTINGVATPVDLLTSAGMKTVKFVGSPMNMWVTES